MLSLNALSLGERRFIGLLQELAKANALLVPGARVAWKRNAGGLVIAVIVPAVRM